MIGVVMVILSPGEPGLVGRLPGASALLDLISMHDVNQMRNTRGTAWSMKRRISACPTPRSTHPGAPMPSGPALGEHLRQARLALGLTLREVEARTNRSVTNGYLSRNREGLGAPALAQRVVQPGGGIRP